jgi:hypothetical protein
MFVMMAKTSISQSRLFPRAENGRQKGLVDFLDGPYSSNTRHKGYLEMICCNDESFEVNIELSGFSV